MRAILGLAVCAVLVTACQAEPGFDEKFEKRSRELSAKASRIEAETRAQLDAAAEAEQAAAELRQAQKPGASPAASGQ